MYAWGQIPRETEVKAKPKLIIVVTLYQDVASLPTPKDSIWIVVMSRLVARDG